MIGECARVRRARGGSLSVAREIGRRVTAATHGNLARFGSIGYTSTMSDATRSDYEDGHLLVAAVRILAHREGRPPSVEEAADAIGFSREMCYHLVRRLAALGIVRLVETPFEARLVVEDHTRLEEIPRDQAGPAIASEFETFRARHEEKQRQLDRLFGEGAAEKKKKERVTSLEEKFKQFRANRTYRPPGTEGGKAGEGATEDGEDDESPEEPA